MGFTMKYIAIPNLNADRTDSWSKWLTDFWEKSMETVFGRFVIKKTIGRTCSIARAQKSITRSVSLKYGFYFMV